MCLGMRKPCYLDYVFQVIRKMPQILQPTFQLFYEYMFLSFLLSPSLMA